MCKDDTCHGKNGHLEVCGYCAVLWYTDEVYISGLGYIDYAEKIYRTGLCYSFLGDIGMCSFHLVSGTYILIIIDDVWLISVGFM